MVINGNVFSRTSIGATSAAQRWCSNTSEMVVVATQYVADDINPDRFDHIWMSPKIGVSQNGMETPIF